MFRVSAAPLLAARVIARQRSGVNHFHALSLPNYVVSVPQYSSSQNFFGSFLTKITPTCGKKTFDISIPTLWDSLIGGILFIKRTFQPSLIRKRRKQGFLARAADRNGRKVLARRIAKGRRRLA